MFKLFRRPPPPTTLETAREASIVLRGATTEGYHYALRIEFDAHRSIERIIGWRGSTDGSRRIELRPGDDGLWRDPDGRTAGEALDLVPVSIRNGAGFAAQWTEGVAPGPDDVAGLPEQKAD